MNVSINYKGVVLDLECDYQPEERQTHWDSGCGAQMTLEGIEHKGEDFWEVFENDIEELSEIALTQFLEQGEEARTEQRINHIND